MKITAQDLLRLKVVDEIVPEPTGGAHRDRDAIMTAVGNAVEASLKQLVTEDAYSLKRARADKFLAIGRTLER